ncbi:uncharacterized protein LOC113383167 [Ctenocephalides felis]|uniref:uncharacterized protein LOC113383167 n=1 Tax=Ctenocephalides felis TaxID=7515 RepID=UPI000E6E48C9|nr:uncharacterized protein LOC113383167 [Ctenocephalides felis]
MNIADLPESRKFMERINTWFYKTKERNPTTNVRDILKNLNVLSDHIQLNSVMDSNLCILYDVTNMLIQQICNSDANAQFSACNIISQSCTNINEIGKPYLKNEPLLLSASKYKSLDTLAGCFTSVESAGSMCKSRTDDSFKNLQNKENVPISPMAIDYEPKPVTGRKSLPAKALSSLSPQIKETEKETELKEKLQRQLTWERETPFLQATSSPIASITDGLGQISLDEMNCDAIMKLCKDTRTNMDKIEKLLKKSLNKTHNLSNPSFLNNTSSTAARKLASPTPRLARGAVGRFSLGAARLPTARKSLTSKISGVAIRNNQAKGAEGASSVLQNASRNIMTARRKISSLTSLKDPNSANNNNLKYKPTGKGNIVSNIPGPRTSSPAQRTLLKK